MKIKGIILGVLLACAIGISVPLYSLYMQENVTAQEAYKIGKEILMQTTREENPNIGMSDLGRTWYMHALCICDGSDIDFFLEISKRTGDVVEVGFDYISEED